ncbi:MAG TPA: AEC family transporter [Candidatus Salinicoccus stercoripullorum]|uniref:AEC family transporter n=1 Tax=Candidatus Salinicoccus stercoripullorum TaxID=2838756 RepID=A0A9D1TZ43_9STAP|nr:AEC family transporter [Candidatus Salinicoccus stercoripullorum]
MELLMIVLPVFLIFGIGYASQKLLKMDIKSISAMSLYILLPLLTFDTFYRNELTVDYLYLFIFSVIITVILIGITILIGWFMKSTKEDVSAILLGTLFPNSGNYGAPVMLFALGAVAFDYAIVLMVLHGFIISTVGIFIASFGSGGTISVKDAILSIFRIPVIYGAAAGLLLQLTHITIDDKLMDILQMTGNAAIPVVMLILGMQLAEIRKENFELRNINTVVLIRMVVSPLVAMVLVIFMPVDETMKMVFIILNAMPVAANSTMLAVQFNVKPNLVSFSTLVTTLLSLLTIPFFLYLIGI